MKGVDQRADGLVVLPEVLLGKLDRAPDDLHAGKPTRGATSLRP